MKTEPQGADRRMQDHPVLGQVVLGYSPMVNRQRSVVATRLTVFPARPDVLPDVAALLQVVSQVWPLEAPATPLAAPRTPDAVPGGLRWPVSLNIAGEGMLQAALAQAPPPQLML